MIRKYYYLLLFGFVFAAITNQETGWEYHQSTDQSFYMFENVHIDGYPAIGDGVNASEEYNDGIATSTYCLEDSIDCDVLGAFVIRNELNFGFDFDDNDSISVDEIGLLDLNGDGEITSSAEVCIGWIYPDSTDFTTLPIMGDDGDYSTAGYANNGQIPYLKIYDASNDVILPLDISNIYYEEKFDDCGYDNICPTDPNYSGPDADGSENNGVHDPTIPAEPFTDCSPGSTEICEDDDGFMPWHDDNEYADGEPFEDINGNGVWDDEIEEIFNSIYDYNSNGIWDPYMPSELLGHSNLQIYLYYGELEAENDFGCMDIDACNYDSDATADNGSCSYPPTGDIPYTYNVNEDSIELSWDAPDTGIPDTYEVSLFYLGNQIANYSGAESSTVFFDLNWSTSYDIAITGSNVCGSTTTNINGISIGAMPNPESPVLNSPLGNEALIFLSWTEVEYASVYRIFSNGELIDSTSASMYSHPNLEPGATYSYKIQGVNSEGNAGLFSNEESAATDELALVQADSLTVGQGSLRLWWTMDGEVSEYADSDYQFQIKINECSLDNLDGSECAEEYQEIDDEYISSPHYEGSLDADKLYCFTVTPYVNLDVDETLTAFYSNTTSPLCGTPIEISGWLINLEASIHGGWTADQIVEDSYNHLGMSPHASDGFDNTYDLFEPPMGGSDFWVSLAFPHPEWGVTIGALEWDLFTTDVRELRDLSRTLEVWDLQLQFPPPGGNVSLGFNFENDAGGYPIFLRHGDRYQRIIDEDLVSFSPQSFESGVANSLSIIAGHQPPSAPNLNSIETQNSRSIVLGWEGYEECIDDSELCNNYANRYPATSYKIHRQWVGELVSRVVGLAGTLDHRIVIFPHDLAVASEEDFQLIDAPDNGGFDVEYFEPCEESDCGWDGLCPGDESYDGPDLGEQDGICNQVYYYQPSSLGADSLSYANGIYDPEENFTDLNGNGQWDEGEDFEDIRELKINITSEIPTSYLDYDLRTGTSYTYNVSGSNVAGDSELSIALSASSGENQDPVADAGEDQSRYILSADSNTIDCTFPLSIIGVQDDSCDYNGENCVNIYDSVNLSFDPDVLVGETLQYQWDIRDPDNYLEYDDLDEYELLENQIFPADEDAEDDWWQFSTSDVDVLTLTLPDDDELGVDEDGNPILFYDYSVRLRVKDASGYWSFYDYMTVTVTRNVPEPAMVENFNGDENLYYINFSWDRSSYDDPSDPNADGTNFPSDPNYCVSSSCNGLPELAEYYVIYRDSYYIDYSIDNPSNCDGEWMEGGDYHPQEYCRKKSYDILSILNDESSNNQSDVEFVCDNFSGQVVEFDTLNECLTSSLCASDCYEILRYSDSWMEDLYLYDQNPIGEQYTDSNENGRWDPAICKIDETTCNIIREDYGLSEQDVAFQDCACTFSHSACDVLGGVFESEDCILYDNYCTDLGGEFSDREEYVDANFNDKRDANESHCYFVVAFNGTGASEPCGYNLDGELNYQGCLPGDDFISPSNYQCFETGSLPIPMMTSPCGGEIMASGSQQIIDWDFSESNVQHIQKVRIQQSQDSGNTWNMIEDGAPPLSEYEFTVMQTDTISFYNKFRVEVIDVGDQIHTDETDYLIIIANNELQNTYNRGYSIVSSPLLLGMLDLVPANGVIYQRIYNDLIDDFSFEQLSPSEFHTIENGRGYYLLTSNENIDLEVEGDILSDETISLRSGWNLIGNPLVARFPVEWLEIIDAAGNILSWSGAVNEHKIMPYIFEFDNDSREHRPVNIIDPFYGYWVYASEDLELSFEPRVYDESLYSNDRGAYWELTLHASINGSSFTSMGDQIVLGFSDAANDLFEYGVDAYDLEGPEDVGAPTSVNLYIDHSDWENTESSRFYSDMRSSAGLSLDNPIVWDVIGNKEGQSGSDSILISWDVVSEGITSIDNKDIFFQYLDIESRCVCPDEDGDGVPDDCDYEYVNNLCDAELDNSCGGNPDNCVAFTAVEIVDMNIQDSAVVPGAAFNNPMQIVVVPIDTSCGGQGLEQCANGECGNEDLGGVCTCAQNYLEQCADNTCGSLEDGSCTCEQNLLGVTCADNTCGSLVDGSCTCEQDQLGATCLDGTCGSLEDGSCTCEQNGANQCVDGTCGSLDDGSCTCEQDQLGTTCLDGTCGSLEDGSCTCEQNGYTTCLDGTCGSLDDGSCTCEQDELGTTCLDGTCGSLDDGSCTCEQDELGTTCLDGTCGSLEDGGCACEQNYLFDCYGDGQCYELVEDLNNDLSITLDDCPCIGEDCEDTSSNDAIPSQFSLSAPYPNPFNPSVKIDFSLPSIDNININIYDVNGEHVDNIMSGFKTAGFYTAYWNASSMPTGIYFISFSSKEVNRTMKVVLVK